MRELVTLTKPPNKTANPLKELLRQHRKAEKGGYGASDLRKAEEHINSIKDMKIVDPTEGLLDEDSLSLRTGALKRGESTSAILDNQAVVTILGEDKGAMVDQILQKDKRIKTARRREPDSGIELFDQTEGSHKKGRSSTAGVKLVTADASDVVFKRFRNAVERNSKRCFHFGTLIGGSLPDRSSVDKQAVRLILDQGVFKRIKPSNSGSCLRWLLEQGDYYDHLIRNFGKDSHLHLFSIHPKRCSDARGGLSRLVRVALRSPIACCHVCINPRDTWSETEHAKGRRLRRQALQRATHEGGAGGVAGRVVDPCREVVAVSSARSPRFCPG